MSKTNMPDISLAGGDANAIAQALGDSFKTYGFAKVVDHGLDPQLARDAWRLSRELFDLPESEKRRGYDLFPIHI